eukprot:CAMPEP_0182616352 /NCGR_PEP_ID=MMETSP1330-20130603/37992_1 /TAXON_ID=464278 /ORGANISM="Picochlorum sp., Strain RCC944" /LENGTH=33 /DNA_ID= /DNA_START= /DNA_END= /DNA_ORIENTATION=
MSGPMTTPSHADFIVTPVHAPSASTHVSVSITS